MYKKLTYLNFYIYSNLLYKMNKHKKITKENLAIWITGYNHNKLDTKQFSNMLFHT